jgi:hypothetical protein
MSTNELQQHVENVDPHSQYMLESVVEALGDLVIGDAPASIKRLGIGNSADVLIVSIDTPQQPQWVNINIVAIPRRAMANKGDILVGTGNGNYIAVGVGSAGQVLMPDGDVPGGVSWVDFIDSQYVAVI